MKSSKINVDSIYKKALRPKSSAKKLRKKGLNKKEIRAYFSVRKTLNYCLTLVLDECKAIGKDLLKINIIPINDKFAIEVDINTVVDMYMEKKIGGLEGFLPELGKTIRCIASEYFELLKEATYSGWLPHQMKDTRDIEAGLKSFINERSKLHAQIKGLPNVIKELRKIDNVYDKEKGVEFILASLKEGILTGLNKLK